MNKKAERDDLLRYMRSLEEIPTSAEELLQIMRDRIAIHTELYSSNRMMWRQRYYEFLCIRQCKKALEGAITRKGAYKELCDAITVTAAASTKTWGMKEFWQKSLQCECICGVDPSKGQTEADLQRIAMTCPPVSDTDRDELCQGRRPELVRAFVLNNCLYRVMKIMLKHKGYKEPSFNMIYLMGRHFYNLLSESLP